MGKQTYYSAKILIVDDKPSNTDLFETMLLMGGYRQIKTTNDSRQVVSLYLEYLPDLIVLDLMMPHLNGFQILDLLTSAQEGEAALLPILVVTADTSFESKCRALAGGAIDFITKPVMPDELCLRVHNLLHMRHRQLDLLRRNRYLETEVTDRTRELENYQLGLKEAQIEIIVRLARAGEHRDDDTGQHTQRVGLAATLLAQSLNLPETWVELIGRAAPLHDVGKIGVPDEILLKRDKLTPEEFKVMACHTQIGADLLAGGHSELVQVAERIAISHHEKWDGTGYPYGLSGNAIPLEGRILAVADVFDALTHARPYKEAWPLQASIEEIAALSDRHFDPRVVDAFLTLPHEQLL